jgi:hypothetical protein
LKARLVWVSTLAPIKWKTGFEVCFHIGLGPLHFVSSNKLYGGTYTQFNDILPQFGGAVRVESS